jgi:hypothetical protein
MRKLCFFLLLAAIAPLFALTIQGENLFEYDRPDSLQFDEFLNKLNLDVMENNFMAGVRFYLRERTDSLADGVETIDRRYFSWKQEKFKATFGNFYQTFGRGLTFAAFEDDNINLDRYMDGVLLKAGVRHFSTTAMVGRGTNELTGNEVMSKGGEAAIGLFPLNQVVIGGSFIRADVFPQDVTSVYEYDLPALYLTVNHKGFEFYTEAAEKQDVYNKDAAKGQGLYTTLGYSQPGYGGNIEYKNYYKMDFDFNSPPPCTKSGYNINNNADELGYKGEFNISPINTIAFNGGYAKISTKNSDEYRREIFGDGKYSLKDNKGFIQGYYTYTALMGILTTNDYYMSKYHEPAIKASYKLLDRHTVTTYTQVRLYEHDLLGKYKEYYGYIVYNYSPYFKLVFSGEKSQRNDPYSNNRNKWGYGQVIVPVTSDHELSVMYGSERGGLSCAGGVCKYKDPFKGIRVVLRSNF